MSKKVFFPIEKLPKLPDAVIDAYQAGDLVVFVGAGISRLMGCRGWEDMSNDLISSLCSPAEADQIINSNLDSKAKITIAHNYAVCDGKKAEKVFWKKFEDAISLKDKYKKKKE